MILAIWALRIFSLKSISAADFASSIALLMASWPDSIMTAGRPLFFGQLNACIVANQGVTSIGNRLPDGVSKQGFGIDRVGRELHVRKCIPDAFNTVDHVKGSDHRNVRQPRRHAARFQDGSNDIIAADLQLCADVAALLHGQGREAAGDHDIGVQILKRIIIEILYNFVFKLITVRTFLENLLNERDDLGIGSIKKSCGS